MTNAISFINNNMQLMQGIILLLILIFIFIIFVRTRNQKKLLNYYKTLMANYGEGDLEQLLSNIAKIEETNKSNINDLNTRLKYVENKIPSNISKVNFVRYSAFPDVGGDQSFSIALLDDNGNGIVLTGIHGRQETRVYAKGISAYSSEHMLSDEEKMVVNRAKGNR
ncbi:MAG: DUF4446 family protein [Candidatus Saccharibacteria bacterium]